MAIDRSDSNSKDPFSNSSLSKLQERRDSLKKVLVFTTIAETRTFNPNYLNEFKAYHLGLSEEEFRRLITFRKEGGNVHSADHFKEVTGIHDSVLHLLAPLMVFPKHLNKGTSSKTEFRRKVQTKKKGDLNLVTAEELRSINGVGEVLSKRIVGDPEPSAFP